MDKDRPTRKVIWFWHGREENLEQRISEICVKEGDGYYYEGDLDSFAREYGDKFIYIPVYQASPILAITQYESFGQR